MPARYSAVDIADPAHRSWRDGHGGELGAVVVKCAYPAPTEEWMWRNDTARPRSPSTELGADVVDSTDPEEFYAPLTSYAVEELVTYLATRTGQQADSRQTCTACHGTGEMHDLSHGVMACDRCNGESATHEQPGSDALRSEGVTHEQPGLELGAEVGSPEKNADSPGTADHPSTPPGPRSAPRAATAPMDNLVRPPDHDAPAEPREGPSQRRGART